MAFEHDIKEVSSEQVQSAVSSIPADYDFSSVNSTINSAENAINNLNSKMQNAFNKEAKTNETIDFISDFLKKYRNVFWIYFQRF